jgi:hypothetical protein
MRSVGLGFILCLLLGGCVRRTMVINSEPSGALVYMNGQEIGRTPIERDFTWYGTYDVQVRKEGYETLKTHSKVIAPWWQWVPFDLPAELFPLTDRHHLNYSLKVASTQPADAETMLARSSEMEAKLLSSEHTKSPTTRHATSAPTTQPSR